MATFSQSTGQGHYHNGHYDYPSNDFATPYHSPKSLELRTTNISPPIEEKSCAASPSLRGRVSDPQLGERKQLCDLLKKVRPCLMDPRSPDVAKMAREWEERGYQGLGDLEKLRTLHLAGQKLTELPKSVELLKGLVSINLSGNCLETLPEELEKLPKLRILKLDDNAFKMVPSVVKKLAKKQLTTLTLSQNWKMQKVAVCVKNVEVFAPPNDYAIYVKDDE